MKLSEILDRYYVIPFNQSELVGFFEDEGKIIITWNDSEEFDSYHQEFVDQDIVLGKDVTGTFLVTTTDGETVGFIALNGVDLEKLS